MCWRSVFHLFAWSGLGISVVNCHPVPGGGRRQAADEVAWRRWAQPPGWRRHPFGGLLGAGADAAPAQRPGRPDAPGHCPTCRALAPGCCWTPERHHGSDDAGPTLRCGDTLAVILTMHATHLAPLVLLLMPRLGLLRFCAGLAASRVLGITLHLLLWRWRLGLVPRWPDWWSLPREALGAVVRIRLPRPARTSPGACRSWSAWRWPGSSGAKALATQAYALQITHIALLTAMAIGLSVEIVVGHPHQGATCMAPTVWCNAMRWGLALAVTAVVHGGSLRPLADRPSSRTTARSSPPAWCCCGGWWRWSRGAPSTWCWSMLRATGDARFPHAGVASMVGGWPAAAGSRTVPGPGLAGIWIAYAADERLRGLIICGRAGRAGWVPRRPCGAHRRSAGTGRLTRPWRRPGHADRVPRREELVQRLLNADSARLPPRGAFQRHQRVGDQHRRDPGQEAAPLP